LTPPPEREMIRGAMAFDYFLAIDGIPGESVDDKHKGEIDVDSWSWGETQSAPAHGPAAGTGKVQIQDLQVTANMSKASPKLMLACASGQHIRSAVLTGRRAGKAQVEFLTFALSDVLVSSYQTGDSQAGAPVDSVSLSFAKVQIEYKETQADGRLGASTEFGWDVKQNKQV
jgi:type VI secretion system secreted protein Hcp